MEAENINQTLSKNGRSFEQKHNINYSQIVKGLQERRVLHPNDQQKYLKYDSNRKQRRLRRYLQ